MEPKNILRCLCVRHPYAGRIVDGTKPIEYRSRRTNVRGRIGIIESRSGTIIGEAELYDCTGNPETECYNWHLRNARRYAKPIPYKHPAGAVVWVNVELRKGE